MTERRRPRLAVENHRGELVPRTLGFVLVAGAVIATAVGAILGEVTTLAWAATAAVVIVAVAGVVDDLASGGERGLRGHLRALARGRVTTGVVKVVVIVGAAAIVAVVAEDRSLGERIASVVLVAACANVWNGLDVRPGRALKVLAVPAIAFVVWGHPGEMPPVLGVLVGAAIVLPFDLRERAMLGDAGSNVLGFVAGVVGVALLEGTWLVLAAAVAVALNVVADTVSFSRVIEATPPLRWYDRLGRRR